jgi:hypothetical protein
MSQMLQNAKGQPSGPAIEPITGSWEDWVVPITMGVACVFYCLRHANRTVTIPDTPAPELTKGWWEGSEVADPPAPSGTPDVDGRKGPVPQGEPDQGGPLRRITALRKAPKELFLAYCQVAQIIFTLPNVPVKIFVACCIVLQATPLPVSGFAPPVPYESDLSCVDGPEYPGKGGPVIFNDETKERETPTRGFGSAYGLAW